MRKITRHIFIAMRLLGLLTVVLGGVYPLAVGVLGWALFPYEASGSLVWRGDKVVASGLLGQEFTKAGYFWGRLSATTPTYNPSASTGSNLSPANPLLLKNANQRLAALQKLAPAKKSPVPFELVSASGSGLDPHISWDAMIYQLPRVAKARHMSEDTVKDMARRVSHTPLWGLSGAPYVNVVLLNLMLDERGHE